MHIRFLISPGRLWDSALLSSWSFLTAFSSFLHPLTSLISNLWNPGKACKKETRDMERLLCCHKKKKKVFMGKIQENWVTHPNAWHPHLTSHLQLKIEEGAEHGEGQFWGTPRGVLPSPLMRVSPLPAAGRKTSLQMELSLLNASVSRKSDPTSFSEFFPHILFLRK